MVKTTDTRQGIIQRYTIFGAIAITLFLIGKKHIQISKNQKHERESDTSLNVESDNEFLVKTKRPGFPENNPYLDYSSGQRVSKYQGSGDAYSSRKQGDRLSLYNVLKQKYFPSEEDKNLYLPSDEDKVNR
ncbi:unnamed protein product [Candida verbasci]|uniref:Uncharacterized protein n=1 Tax=Candida verbasci TaxID=1227364 RepID=A0A9W4TVU9_9ASCO|nr:unnamed protein product [Candida verbasci]